MSKLARAQHEHHPKQPSSRATESVGHIQIGSTSSKPLDDMETNAPATASVPKGAPFNNLNGCKWEQKLASSLVFSLSIIQLMGKCRPAPPPSLCHPLNGPKRIVVTSFGPVAAPASGHQRHRLRRWANSNRCQTTRTRARAQIRTGAVQFIVVVERAPCFGC